MRLEIKTERMQFLVTRAPEPKSDGDGRQKADRDTRELLYVVELVALDGSGASSAEVIKVTTAGEPKIAYGQFVHVTGLVVTPWSMDGRSGISFRAQSIVPAKQSAAAA
jgi:hypothetical protein